SRATTSPSSRKSPSCASSSRWRARCGAEGRKQRAALFQRLAAGLRKPDPAFTRWVVADHDRAGLAEAALGVVLEVIGAVDAGEVGQAGNILPDLIGARVRPELAQGADDDQAG